MPGVDSLSLLVAACPSFEGHWEEVASIYGGKKFSEVPVEDMLPEFCRHLLELFQDSRLSCFPPLMAVLENVYENGDSDARALVQNIVLIAAFDWWNSGVDPENLKTLLPSRLKHLCVARRNDAESRAGPR